MSILIILLSVLGLWVVFEGMCCSGGIIGGLNNTVVTPLNLS